MSVWSSMLVGTCASSLSAGACMRNVVRENDAVDVLNIDILLVVTLLAFVCQLFFYCFGSKRWPRLNTSLGSRLL
jgi:hypothetical protein